METRVTLPITGTLLDVLQAMSEGNPGALTVLMALVERGPMVAFEAILNLDDMNIRGSQIWVAYKDFSGGDVDKLIENIKDRNDDMIRVINENCTDHIAVKRGASFGSIETL